MPEAPLEHRRGEHAETAGRHLVSRVPTGGSGPIGTIIQDVLSILIYFATVSLLLF